MMAILSSLGDVCETVFTAPAPSMVGTTEDAFQSYLHEMRRFVASPLPRKLNWRNTSPLAMNGRVTS